MVVESRNSEEDTLDLDRWDVLEMPVGSQAVVVLDMEQDVGEH